MPQLVSLVLKDGANTPANHTFTPEGINPKTEVASLVESNGVPIGNSRFTIALTQTAQGRYKATLKLSRPIVVTETVNGVARPSVVRTAFAELMFSFENTSSVEERKDVVAMIRDALDPSKTLVNDVTVGLQKVY